MKPLVKDPSISMEQLIDELTEPDKLAQAMNAPGDLEGETQADVVLSQLGQKVMRVLRKAEKKAETNTDVKRKLSELEERWGVEPKSLHQHLHKLGPEKAAAFLIDQKGLVAQLTEVKTLMGSDFQPIISDHEDEIKERTKSYGNYQRPEDYLDSFNHFINSNINQSAALSVVVNRPRDLTRQQLKEVKLLLDDAGYQETTLRTAVRNQSNQDIAASIIGHIRGAALGEPLIPFEQRVDNAMQKIYQRQSWNSKQRQWLKRLAKQLVLEVIIDKESMNQRFSTQGGVKQLDKVLDCQLDSVLEELKDTVWQASA
jgi:type I restriction enzyme R subunit